MNKAKRYILRAINNIFFNNILIFLKLDSWIDITTSFWKNFQYLEKKSLLENVGFSSHPQIVEEMEYTHFLLKKYYDKYLNQDSKILDIGFGVGIYLSRFSNPKRLTGIDLNKAFLTKAQELVPKASLLLGSYMKIRMPEKYDLIYMMSVMQYIKPSEFNIFVKKIAFDLNTGGYVFICYSHAINKKDLYYPDLSYVRYSPGRVEKWFSKYFNIICHQHFYDKRNVDVYDTVKYYYPNGLKNRTDTQRNTYFLFAQKKQEVGDN